MGKSSEDRSPSAKRHKKDKKDKKKHKDSHRRQKSRNRERSKEKDNHRSISREVSPYKQKLTNKTDRDKEKANRKSEDSIGISPKDKIRDIDSKYKEKKRVSKSSSRNRQKEPQEKRDRKSKKDNARKEGQEKNYPRAKSRSRSKSQRGKKQKDKNRSPSKDRRSRSRSKDKRQKKYREKSRQKSQEKVMGNNNSHNDIMELIDDQFNVKRQTEEDKSRIFARRKVQARVMTLNQLLQGDNDSNDSSEQIVVAPAAKAEVVQQPPPVNSSLTSTKTLGQIIKPRAIKRQSKWGKTSSNQDSSLMPQMIERQPQKLELFGKNQDKSLSLEMEQSDDPMKFSQDRSIQVQNEHQNVVSLEVIAEQDADPLDLYMLEIEAEAAPQLQLPRKGANRNNVITFQDVITRNFYDKLETATESEPLKISYDDQDQNYLDQEFRKRFLQAIANIDKKDTIDTDKGIVMENNEDKRQDLEDFRVEKQPELDFFAKQRKMAERKQLHQVDHSKIHYQEVRFNLYREAEQVKNMDLKQVTKYRKQAGDIKVRGRNILNPVFNWYQCGLSDRAISVIEKRKYDKPFPIQAQSIPLIMSGRDVIGIAETGSGKTLAYLLPMLRHVSEQRRVQQGEGPIGIIMTPTRQLARQVYTEAKTFCKMMNIRVLPVYGGLSVQEQLSDFRKGVQIVICTPGRMIDILTMNKGKITNLQRATMIVIDEADRMFDLGFEPQITRIIDNVRPKRQTVMYSATFPKNVQILARKILTAPVEIIVGSRGQACRNVTQQIEVREETSKFLRLLQILGIWNQRGKILIFVDKQTEADFLFQQMLKYGYHAIVLHGAMDPDDREHNIYDFKKGVNGLSIMIATSVCARGLDIKEIVLVINFKCPNHMEDYVHRIGRTGRAGNKGTAITFITPAQEQYSIDLLKALEMSEITAPQDLVKMSQEYLAKVKKGQAKKIRNRNIQGSGFKFDQEEEEKNNQFKDMIKKQMKTEGLGFDDSDDDLQVIKKKDQELRGRNQQQKIADLIKNPQVKSRLLNEGAKAVSEAMKNGAGLNTEQILKIAVQAMKQSVAKHKIVKTVDDGVQQVTKLINQFQNKGANGEGSDFFTFDFQINDYPTSARERACNKQFLQGIHQMTNCSITLRGAYVQAGKKIPVGMRKLYLHIQGENKHYVSTAYKEIKQVIEENAYESMHMGNMPGKYKI